MVEVEHQFNVRYVCKVIPEESYEKIAAAYNAMVGHHGVAITLAKVKAAGYSSKYWRQYVEKFIRECATCQKFDVSPNKVNAVPCTVGGHMKPFKRWQWIL